MDPLEREIRQLLLDLEMVSHGKTMGFEGRTSGSKDPSPVLYGDPDLPHLEYAARWDRARTESARAVLVEEARTELGRLRRTPPPQKTLLEPGSLAWKRDIANDRKTTVAELARLNGISRVTVYEYRRLYREDAA